MQVANCPFACRLDLIPHSPSHRPQHIRTNRLVITRSICTDVCTRLFLTDNLIGCAGATRFGHLLASGACATLERLGLAHNRICQDGGLALAVGAEANSPECDSSGEASRGLLERLCLFGNPFLSPQDPCYSEEAAARLAALPNVNLSESKV